MWFVLNQQKKSFMYDAWSLKLAVAAERAKCMCPLGQVHEAETKRQAMLRMLQLYKFSHSPSESEMPVKSHRLESVLLAGHARPLGCGPACLCSLGNPFVICYPWNVTLTLLVWQFPTHHSELCRKIIPPVKSFWSFPDRCTALLWPPGAFFSGYLSMLGAPDFNHCPPLLP